MIISIAGGNMLIVKVKRKMFKTDIISQILQVKHKIAFRMKLTLFIIYYNHTCNNNFQNNSCNIDISNTYAKVESTYRSKELIRSLNIYWE